MTGGLADELEPEGVGVAAVVAGTTLAEELCTAAAGEDLVSELAEEPVERLVGAADGDETLTVTTDVEEAGSVVAVARTDELGVEAEAVTYTVDVEAGPADEDEGEAELKEEPVAYSVAVEALER